jgi:hypothetical protein
MGHIMNFPSVVCICALLCMWGSAELGFSLQKRHKIDEEDRGDFGLIVGAILTLLGLLIGFTFSMAINRYDQRKNYEEEEANAIGTEYVRVDFLTEPARTNVKRMLVEYLDLRIKRYDLHAVNDASGIASKTAQVQDDMWNEVQKVAATNPNPVMATVVVGMNDVLNRQGYTQAARLNRIPVAAWILMTAIAFFSNFLIGFGAVKSHRLMFLIVPLAVSISFFLIADIDSPQGGLIRVRPQNMDILADSLRPK